MQDFATIFTALTGHPPFPWQIALYELLITGNAPDTVNIPTGLGKTSVVAIWLIALSQRRDTISRRLVYVVNRRTVVDQTTTEVENLRKNLANNPELLDIAAKLTACTALPCDSPLAISTLRGQFADNGEWRSDPTRPAVIIGTVDMIGSGLLFSRYNAGFKTRPLQAAFLGQDALLVHDEAHLEPAFQTLLEEITAEQNGGGGLPSRQRDFKPIRIMALTATSRSDAAPFSLTDADRAHEAVKKRFEAVKKLTLVELGDGGKLEDRIAEKTGGLTGAVLVFVRSVETALKIVEALDKGERKGRVIALTGTMRGKERDELASADPVFQLFLPEDDRAETVPPTSGTVFLVCTSAGEVGVNISADHCVCDLSTYESMAQRFGRVNRFGERDNSTITVVHETTFDTGNKKTGALESARKRTVALLKKLPRSGSEDNIHAASSAALETLPAAERAAAFSPSPKIRVATQIQFDAWALTSIRYPIAARPPVAPYLHGEAEWEPRETHLAWRNDLDFQHITDPADFLDKFPLRPQELLRDTTRRIAAKLENLLKDKTASPTAWLVSENGSVSIFPLCDFVKEKAEADLADATLIVPVSLGGLEKGLFTGKGTVSDVSGIDRRVSDTRDSTADFTLDISDESDDAPRFRHWFAPAASHTERPSLKTANAVSLADHAAAVAANTRAIAAKLDLTSDMQATLIVAAEHHDDGKARREWQLAIGNRDYPNTVLAKTTPNANSRNLAEVYRHEFGALSSQAGLAAHCIAAHHGRARPNFPSEEIFDPDATPAASADLAAQVPLRFSQLQRKYGRWGLAYLESILRAADYAASAGIVANTMPHTLATPSRVWQPAVTPEETGTVGLALDPANPGHFFACCGLFELASRLHPEATAHFDGNRFIISAPTTLSDLFGLITAAPIITIAPDNATASPLFIGKPFSLRVDWWQTSPPTISALKVWAGTMEAPRIARAMQNAIDVPNGELILFASRIAYDVTDGTKKVEPFYFDANRGPNSDSRDVGFSPNDLGLETLAAPAVEFLCLVGLQRSTPQPAGDRLFDYHLWTTPIQVSLLAAAVSGFIQSENHPAFRFESWYRTSQRKHKAFLTATPI